MLLIGINERLDHAVDQLGDEARKRNGVEDLARGPRDTLGRALALFDELGSPQWRDRAQEELGRIGGRTSSAGELTSAERRIATLVAAGIVKPKRSR